MSDELWFKDDRGGLFSVSSPGGEPPGIIGFEVVFTRSGWRACWIFGWPEERRPPAPAPPAYHWNAVRDSRVRHR